MLTARHQATWHPKTVGPSDPEGNATVEYGAPVTVAVYGAGPGDNRPGAEAMRDSQTVAWTLYAPVSWKPLMGDKVTWQGKDYRVAEDASVWEFSPFLGQPTGSVVVLQRIEG